ADDGGEGELIEELAKGHILEGDAARLEKRQVGWRRPPNGLAGDKLAELADRRPSKLAGCDQLAKLARFHLGLLDVISGLDGGAQDRLRIDFATIVGVGASHVYASTLGEPVR